MTLFGISSLERLLKSCFIILGLLIVAMSLLLGTAWQLSSPQLLATATIVALLLWFCLRAVYTTVLLAFKRASMHLEAISHQDYLQYAKPVFEQGKVKDFHPLYYSLIVVQRVALVRGCLLLKP